MKTKLVNERLSDAAKMNFVKNEWAKRFVEENDIKDLGDIDTYDLAVFIDDNWKEITSLTNRDKDEEGYFPNEVDEILDELEVDYSDFSDEWGSVREGSDDWEDEDDEDFDDDDEYDDEDDDDDEESAEDTNDEMDPESYEDIDRQTRDERDWKKSWGGSQELL